MGIRKFLTNTSSWMRDKFHNIKNGVAKFAKVAVPVVKTAVNFIDKTPIGGIINSATGGAFSIAKNLINLIPEGRVKDTVSNFTNKAEEYKNKAVDEIDKRQQQAREFINTG